MKTNFKNSVFGIILSGLMISSVSCEKNNATGTTFDLGSLITVQGDGTTSIIGAALQAALVETEPLSSDELASLVKMRNEEKLARDVYSALYAKWNSRVFANISRAEDNHMNAVNELLKYYGSDDTIPAAAGSFGDSQLQGLYNDLVTKGSGSVAAAMQTGALIEEMDIYDLVAESAKTENVNILMVYDNLKKGSENHLRAFTRQLTFLNASYSPVYLTQDEYTSIISTANAMGNAYKKFQRGGGRSGQCVYNR